MRFYSTKRISPSVNFKEAILMGQAPDKGLFMPEKIPKLSKILISSFRKMEYHEIAAVILKKFIGNEIPDYELEKISQSAYNYDIPLEHVTGKKYVMRLDRGSTASFKDFAARMLARLMNYFLEQEG